MRAAQLPRGVLVSWIARNNDPYSSVERPGHTPAPGPTLTLLVDPESPWKDCIAAVELFWRRDPSAARGRDDAKHLNSVVEAIRTQVPGLPVHAHAWEAADPTDISAIYRFVSDALPRIRARHPGSELVVHISPGTPSMQTAWVLLGECGFIEPPFRLVRSHRLGERRGGPAVTDVHVGIDTFFNAWQRRKTGKELSGERVRIVPERARSKALKAAFAQASRYAGLRVPVLITGERGTGKTTLAEWIRQCSPFRREALDADWPVVACGQYVGEAMKSTLFGWKKGAFTGATTDQMGVLKTVDGDTLFLDEIGDISREVQRLLIRALEEGSFTPLGTVKASKSTFRLVSATNLPDEVLAERLDPDFFDRVSHLRVRMPPLRETPEDLPWMWGEAYRQALVRSAAGSMTPLEERLERKLVARLQVHPLKGNFRDLYRVAFRLIAARSDAALAADPGACLEEALAALEPVIPDAGAPPGRDLSRRVAAAFAADRPLGEVLAGRGTLDSRRLERELKVWLATQLRDLARERGVRVDDLTDVTDRTLRNWLEGAESRK